MIAGGSDSIDDLIASTARGIRLWYIREVDPFSKIMTGITRGGTFLIEDGRLNCGVRNFRFNQGLIDLLNDVEALSPTVRASSEETFDTVASAMKVRDFHFAELASLSHGVERDRSKDCSIQRLNHEEHVVAGSPLVAVLIPE